MNHAVRGAQVEAGSSGIAVRGALTFDTARSACEAGLAAFAARAGDLVVDLQGVTAADSAALAVLIEWRRWAHRNGRTLTLVHIPVAIAGVARLSELSGVLADTA